MNLLKQKLSKRKSTTSSKLTGDFGSPTRVVLTTIIIFLLSQLVAVFIVELVASAAHHGTNQASLLDNSAPAQFFYILIAEGGAIWLTLNVVKHRGLKLAQIGLGRAPKWSDVAKGLLGFGVFLIALIAVGNILSQIFPSLNSEQQNVGFNTLNSSLDHVLALFALVILPPLGEETLVRGYLYSGLRSKMKYIPAMLITSLMFGLAHLELGSGAPAVWAAGIDTFILSIVLVYLRETTGVLYAGMLVHGLNNLIAFGVHFK